MMTDIMPLGSAPDREALLKLGSRCFKLGLRSAAQADTAIERVLAHKWFNIAASLGKSDAARMRQEIAAEMTAAEIATAQRAAREWLTVH